MAEDKNKRADKFGDVGLEFFDYFDGECHRIDPATRKKLCPGEETEEHRKARKQLEKPS